MLLPEGQIGVLPTVPWLDTQMQLPDLSLPFSERWSQARALPNHQRVEFVGREILPLTEPKSWGSRTRKAEITLADIVNSTLPEELKSYLNEGLDPKNCQVRWGNYPRIEMSMAPHDAGYDMHLFLGTRGATGYGFGVDIEAGVSEEAYIPAWVTPRIWPSWEFDGPMAVLKDSALQVTYDRLKKYIAEVTEPSPHHLTSLRLMRELVGFAQQVVERADNEGS